MAFRANENDVKGIIDTDVDIKPFLTTANIFITNLFAGVTIDDATLAELERWMCAHFIGSLDPNLTKEKIDDAENTYGGSFGKALDGTRYGQNAKIMDYTGTLASWDAGNRTIVFEAL